MNIEPRRRAKLARFVRYGGVALIAVWSLLAIVAYTTKLAISDWLLRTPDASGWLAWSSQVLEQAAGPIVVVGWLVAVISTLALMALLKRLG